MKMGRTELTNQEGESTPVTIDIKERKKIVRHVSQFALAIYGKKLESPDFKFALAKILVELFPIFKTIEAPYFGADSFFHPVTKTGFLVNAIKYRAKEEPEGQVAKKARIEFNSSTMKDDIEELKTLVLPLEKERALVLIKETFKQRRAMMKKDPNFYQEFPFYFSDPGLVSSHIWLKNVFR